MESTTNAVEDHLIDGLQFRLPSSASSITDRKSVSFSPHGGNDYKPSGVKVIKFVLTGNDWLDSSTVKCQFQVNNTAAAARALTLTNVGTLRSALFFQTYARIGEVKLLEILEFVTRYIMGVTA